MHRPLPTRREFLGAGLGAAAASALPGALQAQPRSGWTAESGSRPAVADRRFRSETVDSHIAGVSAKIGDTELRRLFVNCFPNTLDTTVVPGTFEGKPDTAVITGDIEAMWLRDSSAQVWPYLQLAAKDAKLRALLEGVIRRQTRCLLIDPYANAFMADLNAKALPWSQHDKTEMKQGVGERKYELDSLCHTIRLAHGYWKATGDAAPFDTRWADAMKLVVATMRAQQRREGEGPYRFQREAANPTDSLVNALGSPAKPVGLIASCFRPSDDACLLPFLVPANLFAVRSLKQLAAIASAVLHDSKLAGDAETLAAEVMTALQQYGVAGTPTGNVWAYEVDGFGGQVLMDDANVPSLLSLPYLEASPDSALYANTRSLLWSARNPWFFRGAAGEGIGGPHIGRGSIWPMSQIMYGLTSSSDAEIRRMLVMLRDGSAGTGFMHESYDKDDAKKFTRAWFAWANSLFGEFVAGVAERKPGLLQG